MSTRAPSPGSLHLVCSANSSYENSQIRALQVGCANRAPTSRAHFLRNHHPNSNELWRRRSCKMWVTRLPASCGIWRKNWKIVWPPIRSPNARSPTTIVSGSHVSSSKTTSCKVQLLEPICCSNLSDSSLLVTSVTRYRCRRTPLLRDAPPRVLKLEVTRNRRVRWSSLVRPGYHRQNHTQ